MAEIMTQARGKFIVFEGLDGSGKSTQARKMKEYLESLGRTVVFTHEPTEDSAAGQRIRRVLQHKEAFPKAEEFQLLYVEDRRSHTRDVILPALEKGVDVIGDRYFLSTVAFGTIGGCDIDWLHEINKEFAPPDLTFIIDTDPEICLSRLAYRGEGLEYFERQARFGKAQETYRLMPARHKNVYVIDGNKSIEEIWNAVISLYAQSLPTGKI